MLDEENGNTGEASSSMLSINDFSREEVNVTAGFAKSSPKNLDERRKSGTQMSEKLSNVSSEDIAMRSAGKYCDLNRNIVLNVTLRPFFNNLVLA